MKIRHQLSYAASPAEVYAMLTDSGFRERVCDAMDVVTHEIHLDPADSNGRGLCVRIDMVQRTQGLPGFARKIAGDHTKIVQTEQWADATTAELKVQMPGKPGHVRGRITLRGDESTTVESFEGEAKINIPLVGGRLEGLIEKLFIKGMDTEQRVGAAWLKEEKQ